jgi:hypothetical protein
MFNKRLFFQSPDFYGASSLIFKNSRKPAFYRASWVHGLAYMFSDYYNADTVIHCHECKLPYHLVSNPEVAELIQKEGYKGLAVGAPYIYTDYKKGYIRSIGSLFMPSHSIANVSLLDQYQNWFDDAYKNQCCTMCVSAIDYDCMLVISHLKDRGVKLIRGAVPHDKSSLDRMAKLFGSTKEVVTDNFGSHIVYAVLSGARVRMSLDDKNIGREKLKTDKIIKNFPVEKRKNIARFMHFYHEKSEGKAVFLRENDKEMIEFSEYIAGISSKKKIGVLAKYLTPESRIQSSQIMTYLLRAKLASNIQKSIGI